MSLPKLQVSFSGGRTSAFMAQWLKANMMHAYDMVFIFANTGAEHPDTLRFANAVDREYNLGLVWVEAVVHASRKSSTHRVVTYETASRNAEPFEAVVAKYGLPNKSFKLCTRELKLNPMKSYMRSIGWKDYKSAIGIRADEMRRVSDSAVAQSIIYPLVDMVPTDKQDVLAFFEDKPWDLAIPEHQGNCTFCFQKSDRKLHTLYRESPSNFEVPMRLDLLYASVGPNNVPGPRKMYRGYRSTDDLITGFRANEVDYSAALTDGGCSESCEIYETEAT